MNYYFDKEPENMKEDKIINNSYNTGEIDFEAFSGEMKIDGRVSDLYEDQHSENMVEIRVIKRLNEDLYDIFLASPYHEKYKNPKRVDKSDMIKMYYYFKEHLIPKNTYSSSQIFMGFAEFFQINYDQLYSEIGVMDKENLLKELNTHSGMNARIKTKKLF
jgi:hypothetical protein